MFVSGSPLLGSSLPNKHYRILGETTPSQTSGGFLCETPGTGQSASGPFSVAKHRVNKRLKLRGVRGGSNVHNWVTNRPSPVVMQPDGSAPQSLLY